MVDDSRRALGNLTGDVSGALILATSHHIGLHRLPPILEDYVRRFPKVRLDLRFLDSEQAYQGVLDGDIEVALVTLSAAPDSQLHARQLWTDELSFVASPEHPLSREHPLDLASLARHDALLPGPLTFTRQLILERLAAHGLVPTVGQSTNYLETLKMMATAGLGWTLLPDSMVRREIVDGRLVRLMPDAQPIHRPLGYLTHRDRTLSNAARSLLELFDTHAETPAAAAD